MLDSCCVLNGWEEAETAPEAGDEGNGVRSGGGASLEGNSGADFGIDATEGCWGGRNGDALASAIGAVCEVSDGEVESGRVEDGARRRHAVKEPENLKLGFEFVGDAVNDEISLANSVFNRGDKCNWRLGSSAHELWAELLTDVFLGMEHVGRHHVFEQDIEACFGRAEGEPTAKRTCADDGYGQACFCI